MIIGPIVLERELYNDIVYSIASYFWNILQQEGHLDLADIQIEPTDTESRFVLGTKSNDGDIVNEADIFFTNLDEFTRMINERRLTLFLIKELRYRYTAGAHKELQQKHHETNNHTGKATFGTASWEIDYELKNDKTVYTVRYYVESQ